MESEGETSSLILPSRIDNMVHQGSTDYALVATAPRSTYNTADQLDEALHHRLFDIFKQRYPDKRSAINEHVEKIKDILEDAMKRGEFRAIPVTTRMKELESALNSLDRRETNRLEREELKNRAERVSPGAWEKYHKMFGREQMTNEYGQFRDFDSLMDALHDFGGVRVCVYFPEDVRSVVSFLQDCEHINVVRQARKAQGNTELADLRNYVGILEHHNGLRPEDESTIKKERVEKLFMGYRATHVIVELVGDAIPNGHEAAHYRVEIQIGTVVMHAWSQVEHDIIYKPGRNKPSDDERRVLDLFNGIVLAGEAALSQLAACTAQKDKQRASEENAPASDSVELGIWLETFCNDYSLRDFNGRKPSWRQLDKLLDILRSSEDDTSGKVRKFLGELRRSPRSNNMEAFSDELPLHLLRARSEFLLKDYPKFCSDNVESAQKTCSEARYYAFRVVDSINMASFLDLEDSFINGIGRTLPEEVPLPYLIDFIDLLHPEHPRMDRNSGDELIQFCKAFLDTKRLRDVVRDSNELLRLELPILLTAIGHVVSPIDSTEQSYNSTFTVIPRKICKLMRDPYKIHWVPDILDTAESLIGSGSESDVDDRSIINTLRNNGEMQRFSDSEWSLRWPLQHQMLPGYFEPTTSNTPAWHYKVPVRPICWVVKWVDLSSLTLAQTIEKVTHPSQWVDFAKYLKPLCGATVRGLNNKGEPDYFSFEIAECSFTVNIYEDSFKLSRNNSPHNEETAGTSVLAIGGGSEDEHAGLGTET